MRSAGPLISSVSRRRLHSSPRLSVHPAWLFPFLATTWCQSSARSAISSAPAVCVSDLLPLSHLDFAHAVPFLSICWFPAHLRIPILFSSIRDLSTLPQSGALLS